MVNNKLNKAKRFYEQKGLVRQVVLNRLRQSKNVLTGSRAVNRHLPEYLQKKMTKDYDVLVRKGMTPMQAATKLERDLDRRFGGDYFKVTQGNYPHVKKVVDINKNEVADFVPMPEPKPKIKTSPDGIRYAGLKYLKSRFNAAIKDPTQKFRHKKDTESLKRIAVYEKFHKPSHSIMGSTDFKWKPLPKAKPIIKKRKGGDYFKW